MNSYTPDNYLFQIRLSDIFQDGTQNDIPSDTFEVKGYPTMYFRSASGKYVAYDGKRSKADIIEFIQKNRDGDATSDSTIESVKDEL